MFMDIVAIYNDSIMVNVLGEHYISIFKIKFMEAIYVRIED
jgi:hypothetical protein